MRRQIVSLSNYTALLVTAAIALALGCSGESGTDEQVLMGLIDWTTNHDLDIALRLPDGTLVDETNPSAGGCTHSGNDRGSATGGTENVRCTPPQQTGAYMVEMIQSGGPAGLDPTATLFIEKDGQTTSEQVTLPLLQRVTRNVTYP